MLPAYVLLESSSLDLYHCYDHSRLCEAVSLLRHAFCFPGVSLEYLNAKI